MVFDNNNPTGKERQSVKFLDKYKCRICEQWKAKGSFSNKELSIYTYKVDHGHSVNGISAKLRCRPCSGGPVQEKWCEGPCGAWKDLQQFSKSSRSAGGNQWCKDCTLWKLSNEPGVPSQAAPSGDLAPDEDEDYVTPYPLESSQYSFDPEAGYGSEEESYEWLYTGSPQASHEADMIPFSEHVTDTRQITPLQAATTTPTQVGSTASSATLRDPQNRNYIETPYAPLARVFGNISLDTGSQTTLSTAKESPNARLRGPGSQVNPDLQHASWTVVGTPQVGNRSGNARAENAEFLSMSSASNRYERVTGSVVGNWGPLDTRRREQQQPIPFTGWNHRGIAHPRQRHTSGSEQTPSSSTPSWTTPSGSQLTPSSSTLHSVIQPGPVPARSSPSHSLPTSHQSSATKSFEGSNGSRSGPVAPNVGLRKGGWSKAIGKKDNTVLYDAVYNAARARKDRGKSTTQRRRDEDDEEDLINM